MQAAAEEVVACNFVLFVPQSQLARMRYTRGEACYWEHITSSLRPQHRAAKTIVHFPAHLQRRRMMNFPPFKFQLPLSIHD